MGRALALLMLVAGIVALVATIERRPSAPHALGARWRGARARFTFVPKRYAWTRWEGTGDSVALRDLRIRRVSVVGAFNGWDPARDPLDEDENVWQRSVRIADLRPGDTTRFTFVVNDRFWVEPPPVAPNRAALPSGAHGLAIVR